MRLKLLLAVLGAAFASACASFERDLGEYCRARGERVVGDSCDEISGCCAPFLCEQGSCCAPAQAACSSSAGCCAGLSCVEGSCGPPSATPDASRPKDQDGLADGGADGGTDAGRPDSGARLDAGPGDGGAPVEVAFFTAAQTLPAGACSQEVLLRSLDASKSAGPVGSANTVGLSSTSGTTRFFGDPGCASSIASVTIAAGTSGTSFYFTDTRAGAPTLSALPESPLAGATQTQRILPGPPAKLGFASGPQSVYRGLCSQAVGLELRDRHGNATLAPAAMAIQLSSSSTSLRLSASQGCPAGSATLELTVAPDAGSVRAWFHDTSSGSPTLEATDPNGRLDPSVQTETVVCQSLGNSCSNAQTCCESSLCSSICVACLGPGTACVGSPTPCCNGGCDTAANRCP